jgi:hypothetical membrane protein
MTTHSLTQTPRGGFDTHAAVTRSLLGWGVVAGPFYLTVGLALALTRPEFDLTKHALSLLMLGDHGWIQRANLDVSAVMVLVAAYGILRTLRSGRGLAMTVLTGVYGVCLIASSVFRPDPADGFPHGSAGGSVTTSGVLHMMFGAIGFVALTGAALTYARWAAARGDSAQAALATACGSVVLIGFAAGAALGLSTPGVAAMWLAVVAGWLWLATAAASLYRVVPHPVISLRTGGAA